MHQKSTMNLRLFLINLSLLVSAVTVNSSILRKNNQVNVDLKYFEVFESNELENLNNENEYKRNYNLEIEKNYYNGQEDTKNEKDDETTDSGENISTEKTTDSDENISTEKTTTTERFKEGTQFKDVCTEAMKNEILFTDQCRFFPNNVLTITINNTLAVINNADPNLSIDELIRYELLKGSTEFFRQNYSTNNGYIEGLEDFEGRLNEIADKLKNSIDSATILDLLDAYEYSKMKEVSDEILKNKQDKLDTASDEDYTNVYKSLNCITGQGICQRSTEIFGLYLTSELRPLSLDEILYHAIKNSYEYFKKSSLTIIQDRDLLNNFVNELKNDGTKLKTSKLQTIIKTNKLFQFIIDGLNADNQFTEIIKTTQPLEIINTTTTQKQIYEKAVTDFVAYGVPIGLVMLGILITLSLILYQTYKAPAIESLKQPDAFEMKKQKSVLKKF